MNETITNAKDEASARLVAVDILRVVALISIVTGHVFEEATADWCSSLNVTTFFILSGYLFKPNRNIRDEVLSGVRKLLIPYASWLLVCVLIVLAEIGLRGGEWPLSEWWLGLLLGGNWLRMPFFAFWFITALLLARVIFRAAIRYGLWMPIALGVIGCCWAGLTPETIATIPWSFGISLVALLYIVGGYLLRELAERVRISPAVSLVVSLACFSLFGLGFVEPVNLKYADIGTPAVSLLIAFVVPAGLLLFLQSFDSLQQFRRIAFRLANCAMPVVLFHGICLWIMWLRFTGERENPLNWIVALLVPFGIGLIIQLSKPLSKIFL
jgi:fucose 4-O-acetylase-like acetyltransferase